MSKKEAIRAEKLSQLQDKVYDQMSKRIENKGDCFSNKDLLEYFKTIDATVNKVDINSENITIPQIQVTNQQLNINLDKPQMSRDEKLQVIDAVKAILNKVQAETIPMKESQIIEGDFLNRDD